MYSDIDVESGVPWRPNISAHQPVSHPNPDNQGIDLSRRNTLMWGDVTGNLGPPGHIGGCTKSLSAPFISCSCRET